MRTPFSVLAPKHIPSARNLCYVDGSLFSPLYL